MSLLDDVSIVVTPNGYKAGTLFGAIPVPTLGSEEVADGNFLLTGTQAQNTTGTYWTTGAGWTISGGTANANTSGSYINFYQNNVFTIGKAYQYEFTILNYSQGEVRFTQGGVDISGVKNANGTYTGVFSASQTSLYIQGVNSFIGSIENVSVKVWTGADMDVTRATAATRVDEDGLVNYAEIVGSEEVTNGDFATDSDWTKDTGWTISGGSANCDGTDGAQIRTVNSPLTNGKRYYISFEITAYTSGDIGLLGQSFYGISGNSVSTVTGIFVATKPYVRFYSTSFNGSISNVSVKEVTRDNVPRIDYTGGGCPHILAEPMRTNLLPYSEDFTVGNWAKTRCTVTSNQAISPDGTLNADLMTSTDDDARLGDQVGSSGAEYTQSIYVKSAQVSDVNCQIDFAGLNTVTFTANQQWQRVETTLTDTSQSPRLRLRILNSGNSIYVWGGQVEQGSFATSLIPNFGTALGVTRNQDIFTRDGIGSLINSTEGVLFVEFKTLTETGVFRQFNLSKDNSNRIYITKRGDSGNLEFRMENPSGNLNFSFAENTTNDFVKVAFRYGLNNFAVFIDGVNKNVTATGNVFASGTLNTLEFDSPLSQPFFGKVRQLQVYTTALSDEQLLQLTGESGTDFYESYAEMASALTYTIQ